MRVFLEHNVRVILFPPHMTHVLQPVDICWARQFKAKMADAWNRYLRKQGVEDAAYLELNEDKEKASENQRVRVRMLFSIYEAAQAVTVPSFTSQGFWQAGLLPWNAGRLMDSPYIKDGPAPGPLPHCPFEGPAPDPMQQPGELFDWT